MRTGVSSEWRQPVQSPRRLSIVISCKRVVSLLPVVVRKRKYWIGGSILRHWILYMSMAGFLLAFPTTGPCQQSPPPPNSFSDNGSGWRWMSQFANPELVGALYMTPNWPKTGYYALFPGAFSRPITEDGILVGPVRTSMGHLNALNCVTPL